MVEAFTYEPITAEVVCQHKKQPIIQHFPIIDMMDMKYICFCREIFFSIRKIIAIFFRPVI